MTGHIYHLRQRRTPYFSSHVYGLIFPRKIYTGPRAQTRPSMRMAAGKLPCRKRKFRRIYISHSISVDFLCVLYHIIKINRIGQLPQPLITPMPRVAERNNSIMILATPYKMMIQKIEE